MQLNFSGASGTFRDNLNENVTDILDRYNKFAERERKQNQTLTSGAHNK
jgi:hypothetical protein